MIYKDIKNLLLQINIKIDPGIVMSEKDSGNKLNCAIRIVNLVSGLIMIGFGIGGIIFMAVNNILKFRFFLIFSPVFMIIFGLITIAAQCKLQIVKNRLGFLNSLIGRGIFNIYLSSTVFYYFSCGSDGIQWLGWVLASIMFVVGVTYLIFHCCGGKQGQQQVKQNKQQMM